MGAGQASIDRPEPGQYVGMYASKEAKTMLQVGLENGRLIIHQHRGGKFVSSSTYEVTFFCPLGRVLFLREQGRVAGMRLSSPRVLGPAIPSNQC